MGRFVSAIRRFIFVCMVFYSTSWEIHVKKHCLIGDDLLVIIMDSGGVIRPSQREMLDALEERELEEEAIALSLPTSRSLSDLSSPSQIDSRLAKAPPPVLPRPGRSDSPVNRPAVVPFGGPPPADIPPPPDALPNSQQRAAARSRFANLPTLFPPTGHAWANSPLAQAKAAPPPAPGPRLRLQEVSDHWYFFPAVAPRDVLIRRPGTAPQSSNEPDSDSSSEEDDDEDHDATSTHSTAPTLSWLEWD